MEYAFYNLLTNAVKYSPAGTHVSVRAEKDGAEVRVSVEDQGAAGAARVDAMRMGVQLLRQHQHVRAAGAVFDVHQLPDDEHAQPRFGQASSLVREGLVLYHDTEGDRCRDC